MEIFKTTLENPMMNLAYIVSSRATDLRRQIGVVIVDRESGIIYSDGSNKATIQNESFIIWHKTHCLRKIFKTPKNRWYWFCPGCALYKNHAERQALRQLDRYENATKNRTLDLYLYGHEYACEHCLDEMIKYNIKRIYVCK